MSSSETQAPTAVVVEPMEAAVSQEDRLAVGTEGEETEDEPQKETALLNVVSTVPTLEPATASPTQPASPSPPPSTPTLVPPMPADGTGTASASVAIIDKLHLADGDPDYEVSPQSRHFNGGDPGDGGYHQDDDDDDTITERGIEVDSPKAWLVAVSCAWVMFWTLLVNRSSSVMYISLNEELGMSREDAAAPFSMLGAVSNIFAMISGLLLRVMPLPRVSALGTALTSVGILFAASFFTPFAIKYCIGIITAIGQSLIFPTNMVAVNTYFIKNRTTASGISYIGGTLVSFVVPFAYQALDNRIGLRMTLFLVGGLTLNALIGAVILRIPARPKRDPAANRCCSIKHSSNGSSSNNNNIIKTKVDAGKKPKSPKPGLRLKEIWKSPRQQFAFMKRPIFYLIVASGIVFAYVLVLFNVTVVAFAKEKRYKEDHALMTLWFYAGGDLFGRLFSGQLSDRGWLRRRTVMAFGFLLASIATFGIATAPHQVVYFGFCLLYGLSVGSTMILFSVLLTEYLGLANLPLAIGVHCLVNGLAALPRQRLIRHLSQDSYWSLYLFLSIISVVISLIWGVHCLYLHMRTHVADSVDRCGERKHEVGGVENGRNSDDAGLREKLRSDRNDEDHDDS